jgi:hypothetical protein
MHPATASSPVRHDSEALTVMRRMFDEGFATGETVVVDELCAADLVEHWGVPDRFALLAQTGVLRRLG